MIRLLWRLNVKGLFKGSLLAPKLDWYAIRQMVKYWPPSNRPLWEKMTDMLIHNKCCSLRSVGLEPGSDIKKLDAIAERYPERYNHVERTRRDPVLF